jgi:hypothetical protein
MNRHNAFAILALLLIGANVRAGVVQTATDLNIAVGLDADLTPEDELNRVLWADVKGIDVPYPTPIHRALFTTGVPADAKR